MKIFCLPQAFALLSTLFAPQDLPLWKCSLVNIDLVNTVQEVLLTQAEATIV